MQTFKVLGSDGKEYGPVSAEVVRQWIAQRRANASTSVRAEGSSEWKHLSTFPEFAEALAGALPPPGAVPPLPAAPRPSGPVKTSGLAIGSLVCGCLGFLCLPGLAGLVMGIVALVKVNKSKGQLRGQGLAIAGIILSGVMMFLVLPIGAGLLVPALIQARGGARRFNPPMPGPTVIRPDTSRLKDEAEKTQCVNNLKQICLGARIYASDHKGVFPPDFLSMSNELSTPKLLVCPADKKHTRVSDWAEFDPASNLTYEYLQPGVAEKNALDQVIFRCPIHNKVGMGDASVQQGMRRPR